MLSSRNVLLAQPVLEDVTQVTPDLGLGFLASILRGRGYTVSLLDSACQGLTHEAFAGYIQKHPFSVVGIKVFSSDLESTRRMLATVRSLVPGAVTIVGGPHPSGSPETVLSDLPDADYAFRGEAENGLPALLERLEAGERSVAALAGVPGLVFRENGGVRVNAPDHIMNMDSLGIPAWDLIDPRRYEKHEKLWVFQRRKTVAPLHVVRGCPHSCGFCACHTLTGRKVRFRSVDLVMQELRMLRDDFGVGEFQLIDDNFAAKRSYVLEFCAALAHGNLDMVWCCPHGLRLDSLDAELLHAMEDAGCYGTSVGIESGTQRILDFVKKRVTVECMRERMDLIARETKWVVQGSFILGFPTETREEILQTIEFASSLPLDAVIFTGFRIYRGTALYDYLKERGEIDREDYARRNAYAIEYAPAGMTLDELSRLRRQAYLKFYAKPSRIATLLRHSYRPAQFRMLLRKVRRRLLN